MTTSSHINALSRKPRSAGLRFPIAVAKRFIHSVARYVPMLPAMRVALHRLRGVKIAEDVFIGAEVYIDDTFPEGLRIEESARVLAGCMILTHAYYPRHFAEVLGHHAPEGQVVIGRGAYVGVRAIVMPGVTIGEYAIVGAGAVVVHDVAPYTIVAGVPARLIRSFGPSNIVPAE